MCNSQCACHQLVSKSRGLVRVCNQTKLIPINTLQWEHLFSPLGIKIKRIKKKIVVALNVVFIDKIAQKSNLILHQFRSDNYSKQKKY